MNKEFKLYKVTSPITKKTYTVKMWEGLMHSYKHRGYTIEEIKND